MTADNSGLKDIISQKTNNSEMRVFSSRSRITPNGSLVDWLMGTLPLSRNLYSFLDHLLDSGFATGDLIIG